MPYNVCPSGSRLPTLLPGPLLKLVARYLAENFASALSLGIRPGTSGMLMGEDGTGRGEEPSTVPSKQLR